ncbi:phage head-tail connector protein [Rhizobium sp. TRM95111]|uniref:head-tail connector protein n=1 Tax=Rhizobium alarense TaxID=2846851 RepID=UPI001F36154C|nr:phage head-tail connector protein [Rhizobium alarense]MCF3642632.1 phage head-tail connector protein [Rhizobium alarense]
MTIAELMPPAAEPIALAAAKAHLRLDTSDEDELVSDLLRSARTHLERETGLALISRSFRLYLDRWPDGRVIQIARGPVQTIENVTVYDGNGMPLDVALTGFVLDGTARPARLVLADRPAPGQAANGIEIDFTAGFGDSGVDVPDTLKRAMLIHVALMFELRGAVDRGEQPAGVPAGYDRLVAPWRLRRL